MSIFEQSSLKDIELWEQDHLADPPIHEEFEVLEPNNAREFSRRHGELLLTQMYVSAIWKRTHELGVHDSMPVYSLPLGDGYIAAVVGLTGKKGEPITGRYLQVLTHQVHNISETQQTADITDYYVDLIDSTLNVYRGSGISEDGDGWRVDDQSPYFFLRHEEGFHTLRGTRYEPHVPVGIDLKTPFDRLNEQRNNACTLLHLLNALGPQNQDTIVEYRT